MPKKRSWKTLKRGRDIAGSAPAYVRVDGWRSPNGIVSDPWLNQ